MKRLLLMSSSRKGSMGYLEHATEQLETILAGKVKKVLFVPYAAVSFSFDDFEKIARAPFEKLGVELVSIHHSSNPAAAVEQAEAVAVGGGNTFALLRRICDNGILEPVRKRAEAGMPYMGWSAGTNVSCPTIRTTNDMPITQPPSLDAFNLIPFQINPHFISGKPAGHNGESREERLAEFLAINPGENVLAIREGSALYVEGTHATLMGDLDALVFRSSGTEVLPPNSKFALSDICR